MKSLAYQLLTSKKALATLAAILVWVVGRFGLSVEADELLPMIATLAAFVVGQGFADMNKEAAKLKGDGA
jgi:hypothetical protein